MALQNFSWDEEMCWRSLLHVKGIWLVWGVREGVLWSTCEHTQVILLRHMGKGWKTNYFGFPESCFPSLGLHLPVCRMGAWAFGSGECAVREGDEGLPRVLSMSLLMQTLVTCSVSRDGSHFFSSKIKACP